MKMYGGKETLPQNRTWLAVDHVALSADMQSTVKQRISHLEPGSCRSGRV